MSPPEKTGYSKKVQEPRDEKVEIVHGLVGACAIETIESLPMSQSQELLLTPAPSASFRGRRPRVLTSFEALGSV